MDGTIHKRLPTSVQEEDGRRSETQSKGMEQVITLLLKFVGIGLWALIVFSLLMTILILAIQSTNWRTVTGGGELEINQSREGTLNSTDELHDWTFQAEKGQRIVIRVNSLHGSDPTISLIAPDGEVIGRDDDGGGGTTSRISHTLPESGTYTVRIRMIREGDYRITITD